MSQYYPELSPLFSDFVRSLSGRVVGVVGHARPDGDCIGSQVALTRILRSCGLEVVVFNADPCPKAIQFLCQNTPFDQEGIEAKRDLPLIFVDCADEFRIGPKSSEILGDNEFLLNIDHHISNTEYAKLNLICSQSSATCEVLAGMAMDLGLEIDAESAQALYVGILTDTGRFGFPATSSQVFEICSKLVKLGANPSVATSNLYENQPFARLKLLERYLGSLRTEYEGKVCSGVLLLSDFEETGATYEDTEGFVDYARSVVGAEIGIIMEERDSTVKGSLRAEEAEMRVDRVAAIFGGGGHACAAGLSTELPLKELETSLLEEVGKLFENKEN